MGATQAASCPVSATGANWFWHTFSGVFGLRARLGRWRSLAGVSSACPDGAGLRGIVSPRNGARSRSDVVACCLRVAEIHVYGRFADEMTRCWPGGWSSRSCRCSWSRSRCSTSSVARPRQRSAQAPGPARRGARESSRLTGSPGCTTLAARDSASARIAFSSAIVPGGGQAPRRPARRALMSVSGLRPARWARSGPP
jgi:hypothetical protein